MLTLIWLTTNSLYANQSIIYSNLNFAVFERIFSKFPPTFSITPGFRFEKIRTQAPQNQSGLSGNVLDENQQRTMSKTGTLYYSVLD
jgi:Fe(3+) dicitrate transport protein